MTSPLWTMAAIAASSASLIAQNAFTDLSPPPVVQPLDATSNSPGTGMCAGDFDGDGLIDLVVLGDLVSGVDSWLHQNLGDFGFRQFANLGPPQHAKACRAADIDNDGDLDLVVVNWDHPAQVFINDGSANFTEEGALRGVTTSSSGYALTFADYDRDGWIDMYIGNRFLPHVLPPTPAADVLYRNTGDGYFVDVTSSAGLDFCGATLVAEFFDYDGDLWPDLWVANEKWQQAGTDNTEFFHNNGDGTFTRMAAQLGVDDEVSAMGFDFTDAFNDGGLDYYVSDIPTDHLFRSWDDAASAYVDRTVPLQLGGGGFGWAVHFFDYDNDGWQDLHVVQAMSANLLFRNPAAPASSPTPWILETNWNPPTYSQATCLTADFDNDGRVDLVQRIHIGHTTPSSHDGLVFQQNTTEPRNWLKIKTVGTMSNRDGVGARVQVHAGSMVQCQWVRLGSGFVSGSDPRLHFGLGSASTADVVITWPSGQCQHLTGVPANQILEVVEPRMELIGNPGPGAACLINLSSPCDTGMYLIALAFQEHPRTLLPDGRPFSLRLDPLSSISLTPGNSILHGNIGPLHRGYGQALLTVPTGPSIAGTRIYAGGLTFDAGGIQAVVPALPIDL